MARLRHLRHTRLRYPAVALTISHQYDAFPHLPDLDGACARTPVLACDKNFFHVKTELLGKFCNRRIGINGTVRKAAAADDDCNVRACIADAVHLAQRQCKVVEIRLCNRRQLLKTGECQAELADVRFCCATDVGTHLCNRLPEKRATARACKSSCTRSCSNKAAR